VLTGRLVTFEGGDGCGKTAQFNRLVGILKEANIGYKAYREPGGTEIGEEIREILLRPRKSEMSAFTELFLFEAGRAQLYWENVHADVIDGYFVLIDRSGDSSTAYQGFGRGLDSQTIIWLNRLSMLGLVPDLTLYFDLDPLVGLERTAKTERDRIEQERLEFHQRVRRGYQELAMDNPKRFRIIEALKSIDDVSRDVDRALAEILTERNQQ
jgi:dTMP kinase